MLRRGRHRLAGAVHRSMYAVLFTPFGWARVFWLDKDDVRTIMIRTHH